MVVVCHVDFYCIDMSVFFIYHVTDSISALIVNSQVYDPTLLVFYIPGNKQDFDFFPDNFRTRQLGIIQKGVYLFVEFRSDFQRMAADRIGYVSPFAEIDNG